MERTRRKYIRLAPAEAELMEEAAWRRRLTFSAWSREVLLREARREQAKAEKEKSS
jgi:hypothetical protein